MTILLREVNDNTSAVGVLDDGSIRGLRLTRSGVDTGRSLGGGGRIVDDGHVRQLGVVGTAGGLQNLPRLDAVRPPMVTGLLRSGIRQQVGVDEGEVVTSRSKTNGVLIDEGGVGDGVKTVGLVQRDVGDGGEGGVVGPLTTTGLRPAQKTDVLSGVEEAHDGMRQANVERALGADVLEGSILSGLNLADKHIARSITHLDALIIVDNGVVSTGLRVLDGGLLGGGAKDVDIRGSGNTTSTGATRTTDNRGTGEDNDEFLPGTDVVVDLDVIEGESGDGESETGILTEPEGEGDREVATGTEGSTNGDGVSHGQDLTDLVTVTETLGTGHAELVVEVEEEVVKLLNDQLIERDGHLLKEIVHQVVGPSQPSVGEDTLVGLDGNEVLVQIDQRDLAAEPNVEDVIGGSVDGGSDVTLAEVDGADVTELNGDVREPIRLLDTGDEPGNRIRTTEKETAQLGESCQIDETGSSSSLIVHCI